MKKFVGLIALLPLVAAPVLAAEPEMHGESFFKKMDSNNDGYVSREEHEEWANKKFDQCDSNKDGKMSHEEMRACGQKVHAMRSKSGKHMSMNDQTGESNLNSNTDSMNQQRAETSEDTKTNVQ